MSNQLYAALLGALAGGVLTFFFTLGIQILQEGRVTKNRRLLFSQAINCHFIHLRQISKRRKY